MSLRGKTGRSRACSLHMYLYKQSNHHVTPQDVLERYYDGTCGGIVLRNNPEYVDSSKKEESQRYLPRIFFRSWPMDPLLRRSGAQQLHLLLVHPHCMGCLVAAWREAVLYSVHEGGEDTHGSTVLRAPNPAGNLPTYLGYRAVKGSTCCDCHAHVSWSRPRLIRFI